MALHALRSSSMLLVTAAGLMGSVDALPAPPMGSVDSLPRIGERASGWDVVPALQGGGAAAGTAAAPQQASTGFVGSPFSATQPAFGTFGAPAAVQAGFVAATPQAASDPDADRIAGLSTAAQAGSVPQAAASAFGTGFQSVTSFDAFGNPIVSTPSPAVGSSGLASPLNAPGIASQTGTGTTPGTTSFGTPGVSSSPFGTTTPQSQQIWSFSPTGQPLNQFGQPITSTTTGFGQTSTFGVPIMGAQAPSGLGIDTGMPTGSGVKSFRR